MAEQRRIDIGNVRRDSTGKVRKHDAFLARGAGEVLRVRLVILALYEMYIVGKMPQFVHHRPLLRKQQKNRQ
jgi:hypothetical protein